MWFHTDAYVYNIVKTNTSRQTITALKELKNDKQMKVYPFDKGIGFTLLNDIDSWENWGTISKIKSYWLWPHKPLNRKVSEAPPKT